MTTYFRRNEIEHLMQQLVSKYAEECLSRAEMNLDFVELIKHNFLAKYVFYSKEKNVVEIGINKARGPYRSYPEIKVVRFSLAEVQSWMSQSYRFKKEDLEFYARLLSGNNQLENTEVVVE